MRYVKCTLRIRARARARHDSLTRISLVRRRASPSFPLGDIPSSMQDSSYRFFCQEGTGRAGPAASSSSSLGSRAIPPIRRQIEFTIRHAPRDKYDDGKIFAIREILICTVVEGISQLLVDSMLNYAIQIVLFYNSSRIEFTERFIDKYRDREKRAWNIQNVCALDNVGFFNFMLHVGLKLKHVFFLLSSPLVITP